MFTTSEQTELDNAAMVKSPAGKLLPFSRDVLFISVYESCKHRPSAIHDATALTQIIIDKLLGSGAPGAISRDVIATTALVVIKRLDPVAATVYAAYHEH